MRRDVLCILVKAPRPGEVKTRLARKIGPVLAAALARAFFEDTLALARSLPWARVVVAVAGDPAALAVPAGLDVAAQGPGDLGERMERTLVRALAAGDRALLVGTDSPGLPVSLLEAARSALSSHDAVLGPADDGGFYLLGLHRCERGLLSGLPWSRSDTLLHTEARLRSTGRTVARTAGWFDVDEPADLVRLARLTARGEVHAPATARTLAAIGHLHLPDVLDGTHV
jgi:rSAM/selenodomain-associated transferase 1